MKIAPADRKHIGVCNGLSHVMLIRI